MGSNHYMSKSKGLKNWDIARFLRWHHLMSFDRTWPETLETTRNPSFCVTIWAKWDAPYTPSLKIPCSFLTNQNLLSNLVGVLMPLHSVSPTKANSCCFSAFLWLSRPLLPVKAYEIDPILKHHTVHVIHQTSTCQLYFLNASPFPTPTPYNARTKKPTQPSASGAGCGSCATASELRQNWWNLKEFTATFLGRVVKPQTLSSESDLLKQPGEGRW